MQVLKVRLCLRRTGEYSHWNDIIKRMYKVEGPKAFWRGYVLNQIGVIPFAGFDLACYEVNRPMNLFLTSEFSFDNGRV